MAASGAAATAYARGGVVEPWLERACGVSELHSSLLCVGYEAGKPVFGELD